MVLLTDATKSVLTRGFVVGCPRSGTTLLQVFLASHSEIISFPESHFFEYLRKTLMNIRTGGVRMRGRRQSLVDFLTEIGRGEDASRIPRLFTNEAELSRLFIAALDAAAISAGKRVWIEKTPGHVGQIEVIERYVEDPRFIHIVRDGRDAVASLYEVAKKYPETWQGNWSVRECVRRWNRDLRFTEAYAGRPGHLLLRYEHLVNHPEQVLRDVCDHLSIEFEPTMLDRLPKNTARLVAPDEQWKSNVSDSLQVTRGRKFDTLFDAMQRRSIVRRLRPISPHLRWAGGYD